MDENVVDGRKGRGENGKEEEPWWCWVLGGEKVKRKN